MNLPKRIIFAKHMNSNLKRLNINTSGIMVLILGAIYLLFSVGVMKATHFYMDQEASVSYFTAETKKCACSLFAGEKNNYCNDEQDHIQLEDSHKTLSVQGLR